MYNCKYCKKEYAANKNLKNHENLCALNPNRRTIGFIKNQPSWNAGLTKNVDIRLKNKGEALHQAYESGAIVNHQKGKKRTTEEKSKISTTMQKNPNAGGLRKGSGRGHKGYYKGFFCDSSYELAFVIYNLDHNIKFKRCPRSLYYEYEYENKRYKYYPDFILEDNSLVEIKGYHTEIVNLKIASVTDRPIKLLREKDLKYAFEYVKDTYQVEKIEELYE